MITAYTDYKTLILAFFLASDLFVLVQAGNVCVTAIKYLDFDQIVPASNQNVVNSSLIKLIRNQESNHQLSIL